MHRFRPPERLLSLLICVTALSAANSVAWAQGPISVVTQPVPGYDLARLMLFDPVYTDSVQLTLTALDPSLMDLQWIKTRESDASLTGSDHLRFVINQKTEILVAYDQQGTPPAWLSSAFSSTGETLEVSGVTFDVYGNSFPAFSTVVLGANSGGSNFHYLVLARATEPNPDADEDGVPDADDVCPFTNNPFQADSDMDGIGDDCEPRPPGEYTIDLSIGDSFSFDLNTIPARGEIRFLFLPEGSDTDVDVRAICNGADAEDLAADQPGVGQAFAFKVNDADEPVLFTESGTWVSPLFLFFSLDAFDPGGKSEVNCFFSITRASGGGGGMVLLGLTAVTHFPDAPNFRFCVDPPLLGDCDSAPNSAFLEVIGDFGGIGRTTIDSFLLRSGANCSEVGNWLSPTSTTDGTQVQIANSLGGTGPGWDCCSYGYTTDDGFESEPGAAVFWLGASPFVPTLPLPDPDGDGWPDDCDNCSGVSSPPGSVVLRYRNDDQSDLDGDGIGDVCDLCAEVADGGSPINSDDVPAYDTCQCTEMCPPGDPGCSTTTPRTTIRDVALMRRRIHSETSEPKPMPSWFDPARCRLGAGLPGTTRVGLGGGVGACTNEGVAEVRRSLAGVGAPLNPAVCAP